MVESYSFESLQQYLDFIKNTKNHEKINGCSFEFLENNKMTIKEYSSMNETNNNCWNCINCKECSFCNNCTECENCNKCLCCSKIKNSENLININYVKKKF